jgi:fructosamine-3-kinase
MSQEMDISWQVLRRIAREWGGATAELAAVKSLDGGCISSTVELELSDRRKAVCKISSHRVDRSYVNEAHQLQLMAELGLPVPRVYAAKVGSLDDPFSYILMEYIDGIGLHDARKACTPDEYDRLQSHLAELMLAMHEHKSPHYRRTEVEPAAPQFEAWPAFFRHVFDPICEEVLRDPTIPVMCRKKIGKLHEHLDRLLIHDDEPRLVHWDVWASNILVKRDSAGHWRVAALLDPSCKFAHVEAELAYMALFHTSTPAFMKAYQHKRRLPDDYHRVRKTIYQVYFLLNHVHLFGGEYLKPLMNEVDRLAAVV